MYDILVEYTNYRWIIGFYDDDSCIESAYNSRSQKPIYRYMDMECRDSTHLLSLDFYFPYQKWRISIQITPLDKGQYIIISGLKLH